MIPRVDNKLIERVIGNSFFLIETLPIMPTESLYIGYTNITSRQVSLNIFSHRISSERILVYFDTKPYKYSNLLGQQTQHTYLHWLKSTNSRLCNSITKYLKPLVVYRKQHLYLQINIVPNASLYSDYFRALVFYKETCNVNHSLTIR